MIYDRNEVLTLAARFLAAEPAEPRTLWPAQMEGAVLRAMRLIDMTDRLVALYAACGHPLTMHDRDNIKGTGDDYDKAIGAG